MKRILLIIIVFSFSLAGIAQTEKYSRVKIKADQFALLNNAGLGILADAAFYDHQRGLYIADLSQRDINKLVSLGYSPEIEIDDVSEWYANRNAGIDKNELVEKAKMSPSDYPVPDDFELGSCGGFYTIDQCYAELDYMAMTYPDLISVAAPISDLTTYEDRPIYYVKISDNVNDDEAEPEVLYTGMHHAREPIGMQHLIYYMYYLLENYEASDEIRNLVDNTEMYFIPIFNVDGYARNIQTNPSGGGMWRKNRFDNGDGSFGIDVNRNYGYFWGFDNGGSSPYTWDDTYRGTGPFSEAETQMMKEFCEAHNFKVALNYHSFSNLLLYPWGYIPQVSEDEDVFAFYSKHMTADNQYTYGPASTTIYPTNGGSDDWMYGEQVTKEKILSYTPECGGESDGFWPSTIRIIPICQENMIQSILAARYAGTYGTIMDQTPMIIPEKEYFAYFDVTRLGQTPSKYQISVQPLSDNFESVGDTIEINDMMVLQKVTDSIPFTLSNGIKSGDTLKFVLVFNDGYITYRDTVEKYYGTPVTLFSDDFMTTDNWTGGWALSNTFPWSAPSSMTDSPFGNYTNNSTKSTEFIAPVILTNASAAVLEYYTKWKLETGFDLVQVAITNNNGLTWIPLTGRYTKPGSVYQGLNSPIYDDESLWVREEINISQYADEEIKIKFTLMSNSSTAMDGYYFDDISIKMIDRTVGSESLPINGIYLSNGYPNPANDKISFRYELPQDAKASMIITDISGQVIKTVDLNTTSGEVIVPSGSMATGLYFCTIIIEGQKAITKKIAVVH